MVLIADHQSSRTYRSPPKLIPRSRSWRELKHHVEAVHGFRGCWAESVSDGLSVGAGEDQHEHRNGRLEDAQRSRKDKVAREGESEAVQAGGGYALALILLLSYALSQYTAITASYYLVHYNYALVSQNPDQSPSQDPS